MMQGINNAPPKTQIQSPLCLPSPPKPAPPSPLALSLNFSITPSQTPPKPPSTSAHSAAHSLPASLLPHAPPSKYSTPCSPNLSSARTPATSSETARRCRAARELACRDTCSVSERCESVSVRSVEEACKRPRVCSAGSVGWGILAAVAASSGRSSSIWAACSAAAAGLVP